MSETNVGDEMTGSSILQPKKPGGYVYSPDTVPEVLVCNILQPIQCLGELVFLRALEVLLMVADPRTLEWEPCIWHPNLKNVQCECAI